MNKRLGKLAIPTLVAVLSVVGLGIGILTSSIAETVAQVSQQDQLEEMQRLNDQAVKLREQGKYSEAISLAEKVLALSKKIWGDSHPDVAYSLNHLALLYKNQGKFSEAEPLYLEALAIRKRLFGDAHLSVAESLHNLASLYTEQGKYTEAEPFFQESLNIVEKQLGENHNFVAYNLNGLAELYREQGRYQEAEPLYLKALTIRKRLFGNNHLETVAIINNLALLYTEQGKYTEAEPLFQESLDIYKQLLRDNHPLIATSLNNLGRFYYFQEKYNDAESFYLKALAIRKQELGTNHPSIADSWNNLAELYKDQGKYQKAEDFYQQSLVIYKRQLGDTHPATVNGFNNLATLYYLQARYKEAEDLLQDSLQKAQQSLGDTHPIVATILNNLATFYKLQARYTEAEPFYLECLTVSRQTLGDTHPIVATILNNLGLLYELQGRYKEAESRYQESLDIRKLKLGNYHSHTATSLNNLAALYQLQQKYNEAEPLLQESLKIFKQQLGNKHILVATSLNNLGLLYESQGRYKEAEPFYQESLAIVKQNFGTQDPHFAKSLNNMASLFLLQGKYTDAESFYQQSLSIVKEQFGDNHPATGGVLENLGMLYFFKNDINQTIKLLGKAVKIQEENLSNNLIAGDEQQKRDYMGTISSATHAVISIDLQSAPKNPKGTQLALKTILQRKGRILDISTNSLQILRERTDDPESQKLLDQLIEIRTQVSNLTWKKTEEIKDPEIFRQQLTELNTKAKELEDKIGRLSAEFRQLSQPITLEEIQKQIPKNSALVEIVRYRPFNTKVTQDSEKFGNPHYAVYILFPNGEIKAKDLGEAKLIEDDLIKFRENLADISENGDPQVPIAQLKESARQLDAKLMQPIRELLGDTKTILLSPDAALNLIPFEALVDENNEYLVENYQITYLTSGRDLLRFKDKFPNQQSPIVLADPIYNQEVEEVAQNSPSDKLRSSAFCESGGNIRNFKPLPQTEEEAKTVKQFFPQATILTQSQATENALKQVKKPKILHIATHGFFCELPTTNQSQNANQPFLENENTLLRSGLVLAGVKFGQSAGDDGVLTALETTSLNLVGTKLVVLSACETGKGDITIGEGVYGLRRALVIAGSESQLISIWKVSSNATKDLMVDYYKQLKDGKGRSEALRNVQLEMLKNEDQSHPSYWAGFIASGDWTPMEF